MAAKKQAQERPRKRSSLRAGDPVMVIAGGNKHKRPNKGQTGTIREFVGSSKDRAVVEGVNLMTKHKRANQPGETGGKIQVEAPIHVSNLMYYAEKAKRPVRLRHQFLEDGRKVRGYIDPQSKEFVQIDS